MVVWLPILLQMLPSLIGLAEKIMGPKTGAVKKDLVMEATGIALTAVGAFSTGGQAETWERIKPMVSTIVDCGVLIAFPKPSATSLVDAQR
jgi:hypothetical protein